jgi:hypothetical protein
MVLLVYIWSPSYAVHKSNMRTPIVGIPAFWYTAVFHKWRLFMYVPHLMLVMHGNIHDIIMQITGLLTFKPYHAITSLQNVVVIQLRLIYLGVSCVKFWIVKSIKLYCILCSVGCQTWISHSEKSMDCGFWRTKWWGKCLDFRRVK